MKLIYISRKNLDDRLFIKDFVHNFALKSNTLLIHESFKDSIQDTRFVTKRISALLSESMVYNNAFSADQRDFFAYQQNQLMVNVPLMEELFQTIQLLILSPIVKRDNELVLVDVKEMIHAMRKYADIEEVLTFTDNPLSPLANERPLITEAKDLDKWQSLYDEEREALERALQLKPARIVSPTNYSS